MSQYVIFSVFQSMKLLQNVTSTVHQVCRRLKMEEYKSNASMLNQKIKPGRLTPNSVHAVKNGRRKMEDRHVVIHDLNMIYSDTNNDVSKIDYTLEEFTLIQMIDSSPAIL